MDIDDLVEFEVISHNRVGAMGLSPEEARLVERMRRYRMDLPLHAEQCLKVIDKSRTSCRFGSTSRR